MRLACLSALLLVLAACSGDGSWDSVGCPDADCPSCPSPDTVGCPASSDTTPCPEVALPPPADTSLDTSPPDTSPDIPTLDCGQEISIPDPLQPIHSDGQYLRDALGRQVVFRGINLSGIEGGATGMFFDEEFAAVARFGFNAVRLPVGWVGIEPQPDQVDQAYLAEIDRLVDLAETHGLYIMPDMHQWFWAEVGMPPWTCDLPPALDDSVQMECAAQFYSSDDLMNRFAGHWATLAARYAGRSVILGFDLFNEPPATGYIDYYFGDFEKVVLYDLYNLLIPAIRSADPDRMIIVEPCIMSAGGTNLPPLDFANLVYSPHIYIPHGYAEGEGLIWLSEANPDLVQTQYKDALAAGEDLSMPTAIGEYGAPPDQPDAGGWLRASIAAQDRNLMSSFYWDLWGVWGPFTKDLEVRPFYREHLQRPYVAAAAGVITHMESEPWTGRLEATIDVPAEQACKVTEVVLPPDLYPIQPDITLTGPARYTIKNNRLYIQALEGDTTIELLVE